MWKDAWRFMIYDKAKLIGILFGIIISVFLIGAQLGSLEGLLDTSIGFVKGNTQYLFVVHKKSTSSASLVNIDKRVGYELQSIEGVEKVYPIVLSMGTCKFASGATTMAVIVGIQGPDFVGGPADYAAGTNLNDLQSEGAVIVDQGDLENMENIRVGQYFSINDVRVYVSGLSVGNPGLGQQNIITSIERARKLSHLNPNEVSAYLVKTNTNDPLNNKRIADTITRTIPSVKGATGEDFQTESLEYMKEASGIVIGFMILVGFALFTGLIIVGLTMYSSVNDRIKDYGTIKAIGGDNRIITKMIMVQSVWYTVIGFVFAMIFLYGLQYVMVAANQAMNYPPSLIIFLILSTLIISVVGSYFSMRKILKLEPVEIFRM